MAAGLTPEQQQQQQQALMLQKMMAAQMMAGMHLPPTYVRRASETPLPCPPSWPDPPSTCLPACLSCVCSHPLLMGFMAPPGHPGVLPAAMGPGMAMGSVDPSQQYHMFERALAYLREHQRLAASTAASSSSAPGASL